MVAMPARKKATNEQLLESYAKHGNIWKVAEDFMMCGQSVHERLQKLGIVMKEDEFTEEQIVLITRFYTERALMRRGDFSLEDLAKMIGKDKANICRKAKRLGLTNINRKLSKDLCKNMSEKATEWHKNNEHPRGFLGHTHKETLSFIDGSAILKALKTRHKNGTLMPNNPGKWKGGNRKIGGVDKYFRSSWEANYARILELLKQENKIHHWEHEPDTYWFEHIARGARSYTPDFKIWVNDKEFFYVEIKGWMDQRSKTKLERFEKYYPEHFTKVLRLEDMKKLKKEYKPLVDVWE